jgi:hypothetical protein
MHEPVRAELRLLDAIEVGVEIDELAGQSPPGIREAGDSGFLEIAVALRQPFDLQKI